MVEYTDKIEAITIIPGSGEIIYLPNIVFNQGNKPINLDPIHNQANFISTIEHLKKEFLSLKNVSLVVGWFADDLDAGKLQISPRIESKLPYKDQVWSVGSYNKDNTHVTQRWGGTPSDQSVVEACEMLYSSGYNVMLYPMLYVDLPNKPWRGFISVKDKHGIDNFFDQYNKFVNHYAQLEYDGKKLSDFIDRFVVGSEFKQLLAYQEKDQFIAVERMVELACSVKSKLGKNVQLTYAANWDEYHHIDGGWHHLDNLWASDAIDLIGINAYFPLTDNLKQKEISIESIKHGWENGEYYDYYKDDMGNHIPLSPQWAIKNVKYWWNNIHIDPNKRSTKWQPKQKPIIFTEYGFPSIEGATNAPYYFPANTEELKALTIDYKAQQQAIEATIDYWKKDGLVKTEDMYLYAIDARYNFQKYPDYYTDSPYYDYGHWVKLKDEELSISCMWIIIAFFLLMVLLRQLYLDDK